MGGFQAAIVLIILILISLLFASIFLYIYFTKKINLQKRWEKNMKKQPRVKLTHRIKKRLLAWGANMGPRASSLLSFRNTEKDKKQLHLAGSNMTLNTFYGLKLVLVFLGAIFFFVSFILGSTMLLLLSVLLCFAAFMAPDIYISMKAKERQRRIGEEMPDFLDTISVMLEAGSSLDGSLKTSTKYMEGPLFEEIKKFNQEIELGVPRKTAYLHLMNRNNSKELQALVQALIQGNELGVPVAQTFSVQAEDLRSSRGSLAKEKAAKANPKISLVTTFLIAPSIFFLLIGLMILNMIYNPDSFGVTNIFN
ncbi:type II secretion system F family protein [Lentibacillus cibarius]|uniref:Type II secretion system F family protein n=1 Tax=Lentibacillus cibarius TaxID=2583219 RepID=A0A5S3QNB5_9BACI|nr:type II secretion system F family protein [Lentibacillus cibarius]TMN23279.1 type II secretion system F family protein [Lentibacillus cibarius]